MNWENFGLLQGSFGRFGPKVEKIRNQLRRPRLGGPKSAKWSPKRVKKLFLNYFDSFATPFWTFRTSRPRGLRTHLRTFFFRLWARNAQMTSVADQVFLNARIDGDKFPLLMLAMPLTVEWSTLIPGVMVVNEARAVRLTPVSVEISFAPEERRCWC